MIPGFKFMRIAALLVALSVESAMAQAREDALRLETGASLSWSLADYEVTPALGIAIPATISWEKTGLDLPVKIDLSTNYAAYIEQWELSLYRESDTQRRHPIRQWRRPAAAFDAGVVWKGEVEAGPPLRPGETIVALLRVRDIAGNIDEAQPQTMLVSRYLMPAQRKEYMAETRARRASVAAGNPPVIQTIPVKGQLLDVWVSGEDGDQPLHLSGLAMDDIGGGGWHLAQVLPAGSYALNVQTGKPILNGLRLARIGRFSVEIPKNDHQLMAVKGTETITRKTLFENLPGLKRDGEISGRDAVRLTLWDAQDPAGRYALARANPDIPAGLYRDNLNRSILKLRPASRTIPWGGKQEPREPSNPVKMRARYPVGSSASLILPHTDVAKDRFFVSVRASSASALYLNEGEHFEAEPLQGKVLLTGFGKQVVQQYQSANEGAAVIEVAYMVRPSLAGMPTWRANDGIAEFNDNGASQLRLYDHNFARRQARSGAAKKPGAEEALSDWFQRTFAWLWS